MPGYAAFGRVERGRVLEPVEWGSRDARALAVETGRADDRLVTADPGAVGVLERLAAVREAWVMATFYLFDPDSWR